MKKDYIRDERGVHRKCYNKTQKHLNIIEKYKFITTVIYSKSRNALQYNYIFECYDNIKSYYTKKEIAFYNNIYIKELFQSVIIIHNIINSLKPYRSVSKRILFGFLNCYNIIK